MVAATKKMTFEEMLEAIGDNIEDIVKVDEEGNEKVDEDDDEDEDTDEDEEDDDDSLSSDESETEPGVISKSVQARLDEIRTRRMKLEELTAPGWSDAEEYFRARDKKYGTAGWKIPAVKKLESVAVAQAAPPAENFEQLLESLDKVPNISNEQPQPPAGGRRPGSSHMRLGGRRPSIEDTSEFAAAIAGKLESSKPKDPKKAEAVSSSLRLGLFEN